MNRRCHHVVALGGERCVWLSPLLASTYYMVDIHDTRNRFFVSCKAWESIPERIQTSIGLLALVESAAVSPDAVHTRFGRCSSLRKGGVPGGPVDGEGSALY